MRRISLWLLLATLCAPAAAKAQLPDQQVKCGYTAHKHNWLARHSIRYSSNGGNFVAQPVSHNAIRRLAEMRSCAKHAGEQAKYRSMLHVWRSRNAEWHFVHHIDVITPYGEWAIPPPIVMCESRGSWSAYNPSGAVGPYQLLGWGAPMPANSEWAMARHHEIAAEVWAGGAGRSNWVC